jgi:hypothetical protein
VIQLVNWKTLALSEASLQNVQADIVLATVDAETGGANIIGDDGNALGYGQVWPRWHRDSFEYAGSELDIDVPNDITSLTQLVLNNDRYSMAVAVNTIKKVWNASGKDWPTFTRSYVGAGIPDSDFQRRKAIWEKYRANTTYSQSPDDIPAIPATNYGVVENSESKSELLYGRRYRVLVGLNGNTALDVSQLRCTFKIIKTFVQQLNYSEITIYNLAAETENSIIKEGSRVVVEAGYEGEQYGIIYDGDVIQAIRDKEDGVTYKLTLICLDGDRFYNDGFVSYAITRGQTARAIINQVVSKANVPSQLGNISQTLSEAKLTRGKVVFGLAKDYLRQIAKSENATFYIEDNMVNIIKATDLPQGQVIDLSPASGLIGVPAQSEYGVTIKCLLNPKIKINTLVHVDNSLIREQRREINQFLRAIDSDGLYRVIKIAYTGDTRGDEWYANLETITQAGAIPSILASSNGYAW